MNTPDDRLDSWKEIAAYLKKGVRTVQRWERTDGLPVHRLGQDRQGVVYAYKHELDAWWQERTRAPEPSATSTAEPVVPQRRLPYWIPVVILLVVVGLMAWWLPRRTEPEPLRPMPLTADVGYEMQPSLSPDGRRVVYVSIPPDRQSAGLVVQDVGGSSQFRLTNGTDRNPAWSPDGGSIAFIHSEPGTGDSAIMRIAPNGGTAARIAQLGAARCLAWSRDGQWLVSTDGTRTDSYLVAIAVATGAKHALTRPDLAIDTDCTLSPDSRSVFFVRGVVSGTRVLYQMELGPDLAPVGEPRRLTSEHTSAVQPVVTPDGKELIYASEDFGGGARLMRIGLEPGAQPRLVLQTPERTYTRPTLSADGKRLVFVSAYFRGETWQWAIDKHDAEPSRLIYSTRTDINPGYSPDGRWIAFHSTRTGSGEIWIAAADGSHARRLTFTGAPISSSPRWSPDGQWIVFESNQGGAWSIYLVRASGGPVRRLTSAPEFCAFGNWSRDGKSIYFTSDRSGRHEIWKMPAQGGVPAQVTQNGGWVSAESPDGRYLYYTSNRNDGPLWRLPLAGGPVEQVVGKMYGLFFAVAPSGVYFPTNQHTMSYWDTATHTVATAFEAPYSFAEGLSLSPDNRTLLFSQAVEGGADLYWVDNFH